MRCSASGASPVRRQSLSRARGRSSARRCPHAGCPTTGGRRRPVSTEATTRCPAAWSDVELLRAEGLRPRTRTPRWQLARELIARLARRRPTRLSRRTRPVAPSRAHAGPAARRSASRCGPGASRLHRRWRAPSRRPRPLVLVLRRVGIDDALRADAPPVPARLRRGPPAGGGVRVRHAADPDHARAGRARPRPRAGARRGGGDRLLRRDPDRRRAGRAQPRPRTAARARRRGGDPVRRLGPRRPGAAWRSRWRACGAAPTASCG